MTTNTILQIRNRSISETLAQFLGLLWKNAGLDALLAPVREPEGRIVSPRVITDPAELGSVEPFAPVMLNNTAAMISEFVRAFPNGRLAVVMRPCELRTLVEMRKRSRTGAHAAAAERNMLVIGVDCPGTFDSERFAELEAEEGADALLPALLEGPPRMVRMLRPACRLCSWLTPVGADLVVGTFGFLPRGELLVVARDEGTAGDLDLVNLTDEAARPEQLATRKAKIAELEASRAGFQTNETANGHVSYADIGMLLSSIARCTLCADCLDACPLYQGELGGLLGVGGTRDRERPSLSEVVSVSRWLASCTVCGMCEETCELGVPLTTLVAGLSRQIQTELNYRAGDPHQKLPWAE